MVYDTIRFYYAIISPKLERIFRLSFLHCLCLFLFRKIREITDVAKNHSIFYFIFIAIVYEMRKCSQSFIYDILSPNWTEEQTRAGRKSCE